MPLMACDQGVAEALGDKQVKFVKHEILLCQMFSVSGKFTALKVTFRLP